MLSIKNLVAEVDGKTVLKGLNFEAKAGEVHAIMGPNGSGKSSLSKVLAGHPSYEVLSGAIDYEINFKMQSILGLDPDVRAKEGIFLAFQYPIEVPGVSNFQFLHQAFNSVCEYQGSDKMDEEQFRVFVTEKLKLVQMRSDFLERSVNVGFSGGEKKRNEILQMAVLSPRLTILDETDSGLDIDALRIVADGVNKFRSKDNCIIMITHYQRLLDYIKPDFVHVLAGGKIVQTGTADLAKQLEKTGYDGLV